MKFNERLLNLRKKNGWSQEELGYKIGVSRQTISKWESGQTTPELEKLKNLAKIFEISVDELINEENILNETNITIEEENQKNSSKKKSKLFNYIKVISSLLFFSIIIIYIIIVYKRVVIIRNVEKILVDSLGKYNYMEIHKYEYEGANEFFPTNDLNMYFELYNEGDININRTHITQDVSENEINLFYYDSFDKEGLNYLIKVNEKNKTYSNVDHIPFEHHNVVYTSQIFQEYQKKYMTNIGKLDLNTFLIAMNLKIKILKVDNIAMKGYCISERENIYKSFTELKVDELTKTISFEKRIYDSESKNLKVDERYYYKYNPKYIDLERVQLPDLTEYTLVEE